MPIMITDPWEPGKIVARPRILKYPATKEMLRAVIRVAIANTIVGITLNYWI
jgi:hypothetical protein